MPVLRIKHPDTGEYVGVPAIVGDPGPQGPPGPKGDPGEVGGDISNAVVTFTESTDRSNIETGESASTIFGKIKKWFSDLKTVAFTGSYKDLSDAPESLPADGGNADTVNGKRDTDFVNLYNTDAISTFDTFVAAGVYRVDEILSEANAPIGMTQYGQLLVLNGANSDTVTQIYCNYNNNSIFSRSGSLIGTDSPTWTAWSKVSGIFDLSTIDVQDPDDAPGGISVLTGGGTNNPYSFHCTLMTFTHGALYTQQLALPWATSSVQNVKYRVKDNGVWTAWKTLNDGGNADTVDGYHAWQQQCLSDKGIAYNYWSFLQWDGGIGRFVLRVDGADGSRHDVHVGNADTVDGIHVQISDNFGLRVIGSGTGDMTPGVSGLGTGQIYIVYE